MLSFTILRLSRMANRQSDAKRRGQDPDIYVDFALYGIIFSIIGARIYYVFFQWGYYKDHLLEIVNLRKGGLAIYGGVIAGILTLLVFTKKRHLSFLSMADSACLGLVTGPECTRSRCQGSDGRGGSVRSCFHSRYYV